MFFDIDFLCAGYDIIGERTIADAILDRLVYSAHKLITEDPLKKKAKKKLDFIAPPSITYLDESIVALFEAICLARYKPLRVALYN